jgi:hypothetical protein
VQRPFAPSLAGTGGVTINKMPKGPYFHSHVSDQHYTVQRKRLSGWANGSRCSRCSQVRVHNNDL